MTRRLPPSMTDRDNLAAALRQTDRLARSTAGPGYLGGRLAFPQPVPGSAYTDALIDDDDGDTDGEDTGLPTWEDSDRHVLTAAEQAAGYFRHDLLHTGIVESYEFTAYLNGVALDPSRYSLDPVNGTLVVTLTGWERAGYHYRFVYAYTGEEVDPGLEPVTVTYVGYNYGISPTSIPFPGGVRVGDLAVAVANARVAGDPRIPDTRFDAQAVTMGPNRVVIGTWVVDGGNFGDPVSPSAVSLIAPDLGGVQDGVGMVYVVRPARSVPFLDPDGITDTGDKGIVTFTIPGFDDASGAVEVLTTQGGIGGGYGWGLSGSNVQFTPSSYCLIYMALNDNRPEVPAATATPGLGSVVRGFQVGLGLHG